MTIPNLRIVQSQPLKLRKSIDFEDVHWASALQLLMNRHQLPFLVADTQMRGFIRRMFTPFHPRWFWRSKLSCDESLITQSICDAHGADSLTISLLYSPWSLGAFFTYRLELTIERSAISARSSLACGGFSIWISSWGAMIAINCIALLVALVAYVVTFGCGIYAAAVLVVFLREPGSSFSAATRNLPLGLGLLSGLVFLSAIFGRVLRNLFGWIFSQLKLRAARLERSSISDSSS